MKTSSARRSAQLRGKNSESRDLVERGKPRLLRLPRGFCNSIEPAACGSIGFTKTAHGPPIKEWKSDCYSPAGPEFSPVRAIKSLRKMQALAGRWKKEELTIVLVPTMGYL